MTPELSLLLVAVALALSECARWVPARGLALDGPRGRARLRRPGRLAGNRGGGFVALDPLAAPGAAALVTTRPLALDPTAILIGGAARPYEAIATARARGAELVVDGRSTPCASPAEARRLAALVTALVAAPPAARAALLDADEAARFDLDALRRADAALARHRRAPGVTAAFLAAGLFVAAPLLVGRYTLAPIVAPLGLGLLALHLAHLAVVFRARRALDPADRAGRWLDVVKLLVCPPLAIRAPDALSWHRFDAFDPIAAAAVMASTDDFAAYAIEARRALRHPRRAVGLDAAAAAVVDGDRRRRLAAVDRLLEAQGVGEEAAPVFGDPAVVAWCPRCRTGYRRAEGECADCPGVGLAPR
ncbi:MAG: hypothetical protein R3F65_15265 [bacterium]